MNVASMTTIVTVTTKHCYKSCINFAETYLHTHTHIHSNTSSSAAVAPTLDIPKATRCLLPTRALVVTLFGFCGFHCVGLLRTLIPGKSYRVFSSCVLQHKFQIRSFDPAPGVTCIYMIVCFDCVAPSLHPSIRLR